MYYFCALKQALEYKIEVCIKVISSKNIGDISILLLPMNYTMILQKNNFQMEWV